MSSVSIRLAGSANPVSIALPGQVAAQSATSSADRAESARDEAAAHAAAAAGLVSSASGLADPDSGSVALGNLTGEPRVFGGDLSKFYYFSVFFFDSLSSGRLNIQLTQADDPSGTNAQLVASRTVLGGVAPSRIDAVVLDQANDSGITAIVPLDISAYWTSQLYSGGTFATAGLNPKCLIDSATWRAAVDVQVDARLGLFQRYEEASPFEVGYDNAYGRRLVKDVIIDHGVPGRPYVLNIRSDVAGPTHRLVFDLYDTVRQANVATGGFQADFDWSNDALDRYYISFATIGSLNPAVENSGVGATIYIRKEELAFVSGQATAFTSATLAIKRDRIWSPEETRYRVERGLGHTVDVDTVGPGGDFASLVEAEASYLDRGATADTDDIQRGWWPFSHTVTPAAQRAVKTLPGYTENKQPVVPDGVGFARGLLVWMGLTWDLGHDFNGEAQEGATTTYFFDYNYGGRVLAGPEVEIRTNHDSAAVHQDANTALVLPTAANANDPTAGMVRFGVYGVMRGGRYKSNILAQAAGLSDNEHLSLEDVGLETVDSDGNNFISHNSKNNVVPGSYTLRRCYAIGGLRRLAFTVAHEQVNARHHLIFEDCDFDEVVGGTNADGVCPFVVVKRQPGIKFSRSLDLDPASPRPALPIGATAAAMIEVDASNLALALGFDHLSIEVQAVTRIEDKLINGPSDVRPIEIRVPDDDDITIGASGELLIEAQGVVTFTPESGVILRKPPGAADPVVAAGQYAMIFIRKTGAQEYWITGDLA